jgi:L-alanine-DL-glutamate epimerase-like enolase superfamily enzyme
MVAMAEQFQIPVMIGSQRESQIGNTAGIHLASIIGRHDYPCDVRYAFAVKEGFNVVEHIPSVKQGRITVPDEPGLGIDVLWDRSEALAVGTFKVP